MRAISHLERILKKLGENFNKNTESMIVPRFRLNFENFRFSIGLDLIQRLDKRLN